MTEELDQSWSKKPWIGTEPLMKLPCSDPLRTTRSVIEKFQLATVRPGAVEGMNSVVSCLAKKGVDGGMDKGEDGHMVVAL